MTSQTCLSLMKWQQRRPMPSKTSCEGPQPTLSNVPDSCSSSSSTQWTRRARIGSEEMLNPEITSNQVSMYNNTQGRSRQHNSTRQFSKTAYFKAPLRHLQQAQVVSIRTNGACTMAKWIYTRNWIHARRRGAPSSRRFSVCMSSKWRRLWSLWDLMRVCSKWFRMLRAMRNRNTKNRKNRESWNKIKLSELKTSKWMKALIIWTWVRYRMFGGRWHPVDMRALEKIL